MTKDEALRLALEALESIFASTHPYQENGTCTINDKSVELSNKAFTAIEEALEAKENPAVNNKDTALHLAIESLCCVQDMVGHPDNLEYIDHQIAKIEAALEAKDEPDYKELWQQMCERCDELDKKLTQQEHGWTPERIAGMARLKAQQDSRFEPQRTWVGLTDEEIKSQWSVFWEADCHPWAIDFARAIEAKLKEKNT
jgi:hypothetical protein